MPYLFAILGNAFDNKALVICCESVIQLQEKNFHASLKVWKNIAYINRFVKMFENYALLCAFSEWCKLCAQSWIIRFCNRIIYCNSRSPEEDSEANVSNTSKQVVKLIFQALALCLDKGLTLKLSASLSPNGGNVSLNYQLDWHQIFTSHLQAVTLEGTLCFWTDFWSGDHKPKQRKSKHGAFTNSTWKSNTLTTWGWLLKAWLALSHWLLKRYQNV